MVTGRGRRSLSAPLLPPAAGAEAFEHCAGPRLALAGGTSGRFGLSWVEGPPSLVKAPSGIDGPVDLPPALFSPCRPGASLKSLNWEASCELCSEETRGALAETVMAWTPTADQKCPEPYYSAQ